MPRIGRIHAWPAAALIAAASWAQVFAAPPAAGAGSSRVIVVCSPGSPGDTQQAQPTMDAFAREVARAAGRPAESLAAVYHETAEAGLARLAKEDAALAMVPLPFLVRYGAELKLTPALEAIQQSGQPEVWSLAAKKGLVTGPASLAGWEITGAPGYAAGFVRGALLGAWGALPADARITFTARALGSLRRAAAGEKVAVLLDRDQTAALATLPFAADLEIVARSKPVPGGFLCTVDARLPKPEADRLLKGFAHLGDGEAGREVLKTMRMTRFAEFDRAALERIRGDSAASK